MRRASGGRWLKWRRNHPTAHSDTQVAITPSASGKTAASQCHPPAKRALGRLASEEATRDQGDEQGGRRHCAGDPAAALDLRGEGVEPPAPAGRHP
jgi:hypothetical protein